MYEQIPDHHPRLKELFKGGLANAEQIAARMKAGDRCVRYEWCWSVLLATFRSRSRVYITTSRWNRVFGGIPYSFASIVLGVWGVPWGWVWTPRVVWINLTGGIDVTAEVRELLPTIEDSRVEAIMPDSL